MAHPNVSQADRNRPANLGMTGNDDRTGTGQDAQHHEQRMAT
jgi:hypothetical protein